MSGQIYDYEEIYLEKNLDDNIALFKGIFKKDAVLRTRNIAVGANKRKAVIFYLDGMVKVEIINDSVVRPLVSYIDDVRNINQIESDILFSGEVSKKTRVSDILSSVLYGDTVLILDGDATALTINTKGFRTRGINEPSGERVLQGPREGFDEAAMFNLAMIRRRLLTPDLNIEMLRIGRRTQTLVFVCYLGSLADKKAVRSLKNSLNKIDIDGILDSNYIAENINKNRFSLFKTIGSTERPDIVAARLLEGRIAVVVDGTPVVLTLPYLFSENFQSDEDYYLNFMVSSIKRFLRYICFFISIAVPGIFVALTTFHISLLPTSFMMSVTRLRSGVPMSSVVECILLIFVFEILKEAGLRASESMGFAVSIVGGLVVGQSAVEAGIISAPMLIAVALSGVSGLMIPRLRGAILYIRLGLVVAAATFGLYGFMALFCVVLIQIFSLKSFDTDYTVSLSNPRFSYLKDTIVRTAWYKMRHRPIFNKNLVRKNGDNED